MSALERIRAATREWQSPIDRGAYARAVANGSLPIARYASFLRALHVLHDELAHVLDNPEFAALRAAFAQVPEHRARLERDLKHLNMELHDADAAVLNALVLSQQLRLDARRSRAAVLGHIFVLEGPQLGGLTPALASRAELQTGGLAYLSGSGRGTAAQFDAFATTLEASSSDDRAIADAILGAQHAFEGFAAILEAVMSERLDEPLVAALNRQAGSHPVPSDVREVQAALRAGERTRDAWAYYQARYGERGLRFTRSDSAWLVTLSREDPPQAQRQIAWLARVLATRGMPSYLLECHLEQLHAELIAAVPDRAAGYETLRLAAAELARERRATFDDARALALAREFAPPETAAAISALEAGRLLVAAVIDEKRGIANAVESLCQWLNDPARFSPAWRRAVAHTLSSARGS